MKAPIPNNRCVAVAITRAAEEAALRFSYRLIKDANGYVAECIETDAVGEGKSSNAAVESLRTSLKERMFRPDAVAPPTDQPETEIELVLADSDPERSSLDLGGPGDAPVSR